jgi:hypothetical protein
MLYVLYVHSESYTACLLVRCLPSARPTFGLGLDFGPSGRASTMTNPPVSYRHRRPE